MAASYALTSTMRDLAAELPTQITSLPTPHIFWQRQQRRSLL